MNEIARAEGWAVHHRFADDQLDPAFQPLYLHRGINVFYSRDTVFDVVLPRNVEVKVQRTGPRTRVEYHTPLGVVSTTTHYDVESQRNGITIPALVEHLNALPSKLGNPTGGLRDSGGTFSESFVRAPKHEHGIFDQWGRKTV